LGKEFSGYAESLYSQIRLDPRADSRLGQLTFPQASETPELQLADLLVHITYRGYAEVIRAISVGRLASLPEELSLPVLDLMAGTKDELQDHNYQDGRCLLNQLAWIPKADRLAAGI
jgi:hypothetical protein